MQSKLTIQQSCRLASLPVSTSHEPGSWRMRNRLHWFWMGLFIATFLLSISGCNGGKNVSSVKLIDIRPMILSQSSDSRNHHLSYVTIFENGRLKFIVGGSVFERSTVDNLSAFTPNGKIAWTLKAKFSDNNPRPRTGKGAKQNDWDFLPESAINIGDWNGDGVDDLFVSRGGANPSQVGIVSGLDGALVVQSPVESYYRKENKKYWPLYAPAVVLDQDQDGIKDLRFVFPGRKENRLRYVSITLSGKHLGIIDEQFIETGGRPYGLAIDNWPDENGDGVNEFVVFVQRSKLVGVDQLVLVDGRKLEIMRRFDKMEINSLSASKIFFALNDIDGDGLCDFGLTSWHGSESNNDNGIVLAFSSKDGARIWNVGGESLGGPEREKLTVAKGKQMTSNLFVANDLGKSVTIASDQNGDGVREILLPLVLNDEDPRKRTVVMLSGADGSVLGEKAIDNAYIQGDMISLVHPDAAAAKLRLGVFGTRDRKKSGLVTFSF